VGDLVFIKCCHTGKARVESGACLVVSQSIGFPGDANQIKKNPTLIFSILWNGFVDEKVSPEWLILIKNETPIALVLAESD
jgi:hypothetical protein|tara:strand:+ start:3029 stop:3271 length:243 start_codon:yes stop_codon:yes gene_type:complete